MVKQGPFSKDEKEFIEKNYDKISVGNIAKHLDRTFKGVKKYIEEELGAPFGKDRKIARDRLRASPVWQDLKKQFDPNELDLFEHHYERTLSQFRHDVQPTEEMQVIDMCKLEVLSNRALTHQKKSIDDIHLFEGKLEKERKKNNQDLEETHHLERQIATLRAAQDSLFSEYKSMQEQKNKMFKDMKATRDQRIKTLEGPVTFKGWMSNVIGNRELRTKIGLSMAKMKLAAEKEMERLSEWHKFEDDTLDQPILTAENLLDD